MTGGLDTGERAALEELRDVVRFDAQELCDLTDSEPEALLSRSHDNVISVPKWGGRYSGDGAQRRVAHACEAKSRISSDSDRRNFRQCGVSSATCGVEMQRPCRDNAARRHADRATRESEASLSPTPLREGKDAQRKRFRGSGHTSGPRTRSG
jgi:hypothetical protein